MKDIKIERIQDPDEIRIINEGLRDYNESIIGKKEIKSFYLLYHNKQKLTAGLYCVSVWGWLMIENYYSESLSEMDSLIDYAQNYAVENKLFAMGIKSIESKYLNLFLSKGFETDGQLPERPPGYTCYFMSKSNPILTKSSHNIKIRHTDTEDENTKKLNTMIKEYYKSIVLHTGYEEFGFTAKAGSEITGGIICNTGWGYLYIDIMWVKKEYRSRKTGSMLLQKAEDHARSTNIKRAFLGTTDFQARGFYEKQGYEIFSVKKNLPPGYNNYSMKKELS